VRADEKPEQRLESGMIPSLFVSTFPDNLNEPQTYYSGQSTQSMLPSQVQEIAPARQATEK